MKRALKVAFLVFLGTVALARTDAKLTHGEGYTMAESYRIGIEEPGGFVALATITFDESHEGTMALGAPHAETMRLIDAWTELSEAPTVPVKRSRRQIDAATGEMAFITMMDDVPRGRPDYPDALLTRLAQDHDFVVEPG